MNEGFVPSQPFFDIKPSATGPVDFNVAPPPEQVIISPDNAVVDNDSSVPDTESFMQFEGDPTTEPAAVQTAPVVEGFNAPAADESAFEQPTPDQQPAAESAPETESEPEAPAEPDLAEQLAQAIGTPDNDQEQAEQSPESPTDREEEEQPAPDESAEASSQTSEYTTLKDGTRAKTHEIAELTEESLAEVRKVKAWHNTVDEKLKGFPLMSPSGDLPQKIAEAFTEELAA